MMRATGILAVALLAGCTAERPGMPPSASVSGTCDAAKAQPHVGQPATPALAEAARNATGAAAVRTIAPGTMVTMDYRADRLNLTTDGKGVITAIRCG